ncbi:MAG TPA: SCO family protein [Afifellaceae bacterium]|nr:SCO family protein [Afifellaceae bacterium]
MQQLTQIARRLLGLDRNVPAAEKAAAITATAAVLTIIVVSAILFGPLRDSTRIWIANNVTGIGGPFSLRSADGNPFSQDDLLGRPHIVYFGFTYCPDLCPTTLFQIASVLGKLGPEADPDRLTVAFVSVDPERDTPEVLREYISAFDPRMIALTGSPTQVREAARAYDIFYRKVDLEEGGYTVDHSASALLFAADGTLFDTIAFDESDESAMRKVAALLAETRQ